VTTNDQPDASIDDQTDTSADTGDTTDWKAEAEKFKALHRKQEERAAKNAAAAKELDRIRAESATDMEKAVAAAAAEARTDALRTVGSRLVDAEVKAAAAGRDIDIKALLEGLDRSRFLDDDGEPDVDAISKWVDRIAPTGDTRRPRVPAGVRDSGSAATDPVRDFTNLIKAQTGR
jgi:hypothetical protein